MIINPHIHNLIKTYMKQGSQNSAVEKTPAKASVKGSDKMEFSQEGKAILTALQTVKNLPEVRPEKVAALKEAVKSGTYSVSTDAVAEKIVDSNIFDKLV